MERYGLGGHAVLFVHGFATASFLWRAVAPPLAADGHTALAADLLGYGESDRPLDAEYGIAAQAEYMDRALAALRVDTATVVGLGIGAGVALHLAARRPARVTGLVLVNGVALDECPGRDVRTIQLGSARFALRISRAVLGAAPLLREVLERSVADRGAMPARLLARYLAPYVGGEGVVHLLTLARALRQEDMSELDLAPLRAPTTIVWGEAEPWLDPGLPERLQGAIPGSIVVRLPGIGRLVPEEAPDALVRIVREMIERSAPPAR